MKKDRLIKNIILLVLVLAVFFIMNYLMSERIIKGYDQRIIITIGINIILAVSLNIILGFTGQLALGHAGFMSIGAYAAAMLTLKMHTPFIVSLLFGAAFAALIALLIGYPILRLKGDYLAICTLGFGEIVKVIIQNIDAVGGARGLTGIPMKTNFAWVYFLVVAVIIITWNLAKSSHGRAMLSVREDEIAAESMGVNIAKAKIMAFTIGGFFAGIAGGLYAHYFMFLDPKSFDFLKSTDILTYVVFGGMGSISGSVIAAGVLTWLPEMLRDFSNIQDYRIIIFALLLIILMIFRPQGLMGVKEVSLNSFKFWKWKIFNRKGGGTDVAS